MIKIIVNGKGLEQALRLLKKRTAGLLREYRERRHFKKPSQIKREKIKASQRKRRNKR